MTYYDMHSHILPQLDDGSKSVEMSLQLIEKLKAQNVFNVCFTPHFYTNEQSLESFLEKRQKSIELLIPNLPKDINFCVGAEVYVTEYLFGNNDLSQICYGNSKYILCEFPFGSHFGYHTMEFFSKLKYYYGLKPVLTHIERYHHLMEDEGLVEDLLDEDIIIQSNVGAYKGFSQKRRLLKYIKNGYITVLGTDCHNLTRGNPDEYQATIDLIAKKCGQQYVDNIVKQSAEIFNSAL